MSIAKTRDVSNAKIRITEDVFVRDSYGVRRQAFFKDDIVDSYVYDSVIAHNEVVGQKPTVEEVKADEPETEETLEKDGVETKALKPKATPHKKKGA